LATDSLESPVALGESSTFPGAATHFTLLVRGTHTMDHIMILPLLVA